MKKSKKAKRASSRPDGEKLDQVIGLLQFSVAIELFQGGVPQAQIGKKLGIATASVNSMLKGIQKN